MNFDSMKKLHFENCIFTELSRKMWQVSKSIIYWWYRFHGRLYLSLGDLYIDIPLNSMEVVKIQIKTVVFHVCEALNQIGTGIQWS